MTQETLSQNGNSLFKYAISRLRPEAFSHPVWVRFGRQEPSGALNTVEDLLDTARDLQVNDASTACQILLICAVYQNYSGQRYMALRTTHQALDLAQQRGLGQEVIWAMWGACAISFQQGNNEQAVRQFADLQAELSEQYEWILADFVDVVKQSLSHHIALSPGQRSGGPRHQSFEDLLALTNDWLQNWGFSAHRFGSEFAVQPRRPVDHARQPLFSVQRWRGHWHSLILAFRGELKIQWTGREADSAGKPSSFWASLRSWLGVIAQGREVETGSVVQTPPISQLPTSPGTPVRPVAGASPLRKDESRRKKPEARIRRAGANHHAGQATTAMPVAVHMLGAFSMTIGALPVRLPASRGLSLLKYLLLHHRQSLPREMLMDVFWPDVDPETARNNLNVTLHGLRKALRSIVFMPVIVFEAGAYGLEPNLHVWLDVEEFERCVQAGQRLESRNQLTGAVAEYEAAISLYQGDLLEQNPYEEWSVLDRERLRVAFLDTLDRLSQIYFSQERYAACITVCQLILTRDRCREDAHCLLMRCYSRQGQHHLALRQYQICAEALHVELEVEPAPETTQLHDRIRRHEQI